MRRGTLIAIIALFLLIAIAATIQLGYGSRGDRDLPGPGAPSTPAG
ncbi:MAG TPA: hypothetical protein VM638_01770 [Actinomycetota bacterium]|nr:hypothetical protein [Actinomycetota bacterium]